MANVIPLGRMKHLILIQAPPTLTSSSNGVVPDWTTIDKVYAAIEPVNVSERQGNDTRSAVTTHIVTTRYIDGVTTKGRIKFGSRIFAIIGVENVDEADDMLRLSCAERAA